MADDQQGQQDGSEPEQDIELLKLQLAQMTETCKRAFADFANYKKFIDEQKSNAAWYGTSQLFLDVLPIVDNLSRALAHMSELPEEHRTGLEAIQRQLTQLLEKHHVKEMVTIGMPFNPQFHEVVAQGPGAANIIIEEFEKGYTLDTKVLRPAKVKVGQG